MLYCKCFLIFVVKVRLVKTSIDPGALGKPLSSFGESAAQMRVVSASDCYLLDRCITHLGGGSRDTGVLADSLVDTAVRRSACTVVTSS
jgi:hypothetical protein